MDAPLAFVAWLILTGDYNFLNSSVAKVFALGDKGIPGLPNGTQSVSIWKKIGTLFSA